MTNPVNITAIVEDEALVETRRGQIVAAATTLFSSQGFYKTTIKDIAKKAGISPGLVYLYVREKEDVLLLVLLQVVNAYVEEIPPAIDGIDDPLLKLAAAVRAYCEVVDKYRAASVLAYRSTKSLSPERRLLIQSRETETNEILGAIIIECMKAGLVRKLNVDIVIYQIVLAAHGWALKSWYFKSRFTLTEYVDETLDILFAGILTEKGRKHLQSVR
ncbi:MAG: TetR/AcrR family transcriptional regulator [Notoacmeibacter sp.]|nr:TetR/AcrR family transcriptional regulator [Notoacmeibacter sp.]